MEMLPNSHYVHTSFNKRSRHVHVCVIQKNRLFTAPLLFGNIIERDYHLDLLAFFEHGESVFTGGADMDFLKK